MDVTHALKDRPSNDLRVDQVVLRLGEHSKYLALDSEQDWLEFLQFVDQAREHLQEQKWMPRD